MGGKDKELEEEGTKNKDKEEQWERRTRRSVREGYGTVGASST
jgi:hypothetical protein